MMKTILAALLILAPLSSGLYAQTAGGQTMGVGVMPAPGTKLRLVPGGYVYHGVSTWQGVHRVYLESCDVQGGKVSFAAFTDLGSQFATVRTITTSVNSTFVLPGQKSGSFRTVIVTNYEACSVTIRFED